VLWFYAVAVWLLVQFAWRLGCIADAVEYVPGIEEALGILSLTGFTRSMQWRYGWMKWQRMLQRKDSKFNRQCCEFQWQRFETFDVEMVEVRLSV